MKFDFDFLKDRYDYELKRKDQITAALPLPVGILIALGTVITAMARSFSYMDGYLTGCFLISLSLAVGAFLFCAVNLGCAYYRQTYWYLPLLNKLQTSRELYKAIYLRAGDDSSQHEKQLSQEADDLFQNKLEKNIIEAADENTQTNDLRSDRYLYRARRAILVAIVSTVSHGCTLRCRSGDVLMPSEKTTTPPKPPPVTKPKPEVVKSQLPKFPPNRQIREGD